MFTMKMCSHAVKAASSAWDQAGSQNTSGAFNESSQIPCEVEHFSSSSKQEVKRLTCLRSERKKEAGRARADKKNWAGCWNHLYYPDKVKEGSKGGLQQGCRCFSECHHCNSGDGDAQSMPCAFPWTEKGSVNGVGWGRGHVGIEEESRVCLPWQGTGQVETQGWM